MDENTLKQEQLKMVLEIMPTAEEARKLKEFKGVPAVHRNADVKSILS